MTIYEIMLTIIIGLILVVMIIESVMRCLINERIRQDIRGLQNEMIFRSREIEIMRDEILELKKVDDK